MSPETVTARNLERTGYAAAHLDQARDVVIVEGPVARPAAADLPEGVVEAYEARHGWQMDPEDEGMPFYVLTPRRAMTWLAEDIRATAARWIWDGAA